MRNYSGFDISITPLAVSGIEAVSLHYSASIYTSVGVDGTERRGMERYKYCGAKLDAI